MKGRYGMNFIYVMSVKDKNKMVSLGYDLIREDTRNSMWVFKNKDTFACEDEISGAGIKFVLSNTLTF